MFSGIQPSGNIHIGNYLGAIQHWVELQAEHDGIFCIVDLHAITTFQQPSILRAKIHEVAGLLVAAGPDYIDSLLAEGHSQSQTNCRKDFNRGQGDRGIGLMVTRCEFC